MKTNTLLLAGVLWGSLFFFTGCETGNIPEPEPILTGQLAFTAKDTRDGGSGKDDFDNPYSDRNLREVPDAVGVFVNKADTYQGPTTSVMANAIYRVSQHLSENVDGDGVKLFWYKTSHPAAYWDMSSFFDIYAYAPIVEGNNEYYTISDAGVVTFNMDRGVGIPVDFIYAKEEGTKDAKAESLHMRFQHKLCKMVFRLKNGTHNVVVCNGVRYSIKYPAAKFNLIEDEWTFLDIENEVDIQLTEQREIFGNETYDLPGLTTLLFPTDASNLNTTDGVEPTGVILEFVVILNNHEYTVKADLENLNLEYTEGKLIVLTFNCTLTQGGEQGDDGLLWNIYSATFDSFEDGGSYTGRLE